MSRGKLEKVLVEHKIMSCKRDVGGAVEGDWNIGICNRQIISQS